MFLKTLPDGRRAKIGNYVNRLAMTVPGCKQLIFLFFLNSLIPQ